MHFSRKAGDYSAWNASSLMIQILKEIFNQVRYLKNTLKFMFTHDVFLIKQQVYETGLEH